MTLFHIFLLSSLIPISCTLGNSTGLSLTLIRRNSLESPFFQDNLNDASSNYLSEGQSKILRPQITVRDIDFLVKIGFGTFNSIPPYKEYYLVLDTGSSISWIQCQGCNPCFKQIQDPFPMNSSKSFQRILCEDKSCTPKLCDGKYCSYDVRYLSGEYTSGILAKETFSFTSNSTTIEKVGSVVFGCGLNNTLRPFQGNFNISGVLGLGWGPSSFVNQIRSLTDGRFSYCLPVGNGNISQLLTTYLRFGSDIPVPRNANMAKMSMIDGQSPYYVELQGVSLNGRRIIDAKVLGLRSNGSRCWVDSGTTFSELIEPAYNILKNEVQNYFARFKDLTLYYKNKRPCYYRQKPEGYKNLPTITFHFQGSRSGIFGKSRADLVLRPESSFRIDTRSVRESFCLAIAPSKTINVLGSFQQTNQRIIYDTKASRLLFYPEDCSKNS